MSNLLGGMCLIFREECVQSSGRNTRLIVWEEYVSNILGGMCLIFWEECL
jgi:hypothetical protein